MIDVRKHLPHAGSMVLIDTVDYWDDERIVCRSSSHLRPDNPLTRPTGLGAICAAEYGGQAMALHGNLRSGGAAAPAVLAGLRDVVLHVSRLDRAMEDLTIEAELMLAMADGFIYSFSVALPNAPLVEGRAIIVNRVQ